MTPDNERTVTDLPRLIKHRQRLPGPRFYGVHVWNVDTESTEWCERAAETNLADQVDAAWKQVAKLNRKDPESIRYVVVAQDR